MPYEDLFEPIGKKRMLVEGRALSLDALPARCVRYIFSDASVGRDMHTIAPDAWQTDNFARNPVFLWAHQSDEPPIGRVEDLRTEAGRLTGLVRYAERDAYPFADTIYELTKRGFLNATSTGWIPLEWSAANDRARPGGLNFRKVELLEISQVPVPALPTALATARSAGVDTKPLFDWAERILDLGGQTPIGRAELEDLRKAARMPSAHRRDAGDVKCGAARDLSIDHTAKWDGPEAQSRMLDAATENGKINVARARRGFLLYDAGNAQERGAYKEPFADLIDGKLTAVASGIRAAASRLPQVTEANEAAKAAARKVLDAYEKKMHKTDDDSDGERSFDRLAQIALERDLGHVSELCYHMANLERCYARCFREAQAEGDGSEIPGRMRGWLDDGHRILRDMTAEETQEHIDGTQADPYSEYGVMEGRAIESAVARALKNLGVIRIGKKISAETRGRIRKAHGHAKAAVDTLSSLIDDDDDANPEGETSDGDEAGDESRALRERKARARAVKLGVQASSP